MSKHSLRQSLLWSVAFAIAGAFQFWRGAPTDGVIFLLAIAYLALVRFRSIGTSTEKCRSACQVLYLLLIFLLVSAKIHSVFSLILILMFVPILILIKQDEVELEVPNTPMFRSVISWASLAIGVCIWELASYIAGELTKNSVHYPTISMLTDPMLQDVVGKGFFVLAWGWVGYELIFKRVAQK